MEKEVVKFCIDKKEVAIAIKDIFKYKRLRTQKYLFCLDGANEEKPKNKTTKKASKKTTKKEEKVVEDKE